MSPPDRAAVERLIEELRREADCWEGYPPDTRYRASDALCNLLQRLELAEQEKAEAVAQRDEALKKLDEFVAETVAAYEESDELEAQRDAAEEKAAQFVAALHAAQPELEQAILDRATAEAQRDEAVALLRELEWAADDQRDIAVCPSCWSARRFGHVPTCRLGALLAAYDAKERS
jgi:DNA repair exonuclease SbcCD ATPase subunit